MGFQARLTKRNTILWNLFDCKEWLHEIWQADLHNVNKMDYKIEML
jgi:hypothetical protein